MAGNRLCSVNCSDIYIENVNDELEINCQNCIQLNSELQETKEEILSYKEIIKVLQAELSDKVRLKNPSELNKIIIVIKLKLH
jgi:hypothetical protein